MVSGARRLRPSGPTCCGQMHVFPDLMYVELQTKLHVLLLLSHASTPLGGAGVGQGVHVESHPLIAGAIGTQLPAHIFVG